MIDIKKIDREMDDKLDRIGRSQYCQNKNFLDISPSNL